PNPAREAIRKFVSIFLPEFADKDFNSTKLCWYTDLLDNLFVIDHVPTYTRGSVFVETGGSGHGAKFLPVLGEYHDLFIIFYTGYLIALWPGAWLSQRTGQKQFIVGSLLLRAFLLGMHPLAKTGGQLMALRFILGMTESQIVPSTTILHQAFFPPKKSAWVQLLRWASESLANVLLTMVAYKLILLDDSQALVGGLSSWKWLHICVILTFIVCVPLAFFLPNSPVEAKWLSTE
ncbi:FAD dependent oxidoreductase, partial [Colletotrichum salicis]